MESAIKFQFDVYQHHFKHPLRTNHGVWRAREGIIVSLTNRAGVISRGEIAPLPWFGSETISQAIEFCQQLGETISLQNILSIPNRLPCCQFALESAWLNLTQDGSDRPNNLDYCYLLPAGESALTTWQEIYRTQTATTFKWKIGVLPSAREIEILKQLADALPSNIKLRLDANGGLNLSQARQLLSIADTIEAIAFIEQPLPPDSLAKMMQLSQEYTTLLALDESVASFRQLQQAYWQGWQGVYVVKAAIMGFPSRLIKFCRDRDFDVVLSSVFETKVGRDAVLNLTNRLNHPRAVGFGVQHYFEE